ncbi:unnamed protein product [Linum tenue]|uniref:BHLH domain-containing protein n=1 Tax=Linum tenue TaxID=586396 RepID=A0AAV0J2U5_9ROSI|nr:unnamed protein product [Linum tenue]
MSPLYQGNELCFQISSNPQHLILPTTLPTTPNPHHTYHVPAPHGTISAIPAVAPPPRRRKTPAATAAVMETDISGGQSHEKKMMHREIERQRRQEMSTLYASLRSLLPLHFIKGKRSMSDHMDEAVNYIKQLQRRIQDLDAHKNELMGKKNTTLTNNNGSTVEVRRCLGGLEIVLAEEGGSSLRLSRVMRLLLEEGLSVVNCVSTVVNRKSFHTLVAEVIFRNRVSNYGGRKGAIW